MSEVKICGVTDEAGLAAAIQGGARYIGLVHFPKSPRHLPAERARRLAETARGRAAIVLVTVDAEDALLATLAESIAPDYLQLHGAETPQRAKAAARFAGQGVIKALPIATAADFAPAAAFADVVDFFLFDAKAPAGAALPGGNGAAFDWPLLKGRRFARPWFLSGGLTPQNVAAAIDQSGAQRVDVSSGVEAAPGVKDPARIAAFLAAAKGL